MLAIVTVIPVPSKAGVHETVIGNPGCDAPPLDSERARHPWQQRRFNSLGVLHLHGAESDAAAEIPDSTSLSANPEHAFPST